MAKKLLKYFKNSLVFLGRLSYLALGNGLILLVAYLFAHGILDGKINQDVGILVGNDSGFALSLVYWFDRFFPKIPLWYPLQGMGVSLFHSSPMALTFLIILLKRLTQLTAVEWFRILSFVTFPLTAFGIYLWTWVRLKHQTIALIAALFFLLSQASWLFQALHGIFAQSFSLVLVAPVFLFFDLFLERWLKKEGQRFSSRVFLILTIGLLGVNFLIHVVGGAMTAIALIAWSGLRFGLVKGKRIGFKWQMRSGLRGFVLAAAVVVLSVSLMAFWLVPFSSYSRLANREGLNTRSVGQIQEESLKIKSLLGIQTLGEGIYRYDFFFFAAPVLVFFVIGVLLAFWQRDKKIISLVLIIFFFVFLATSPIYWPSLASLFQFFFTTVYFRALIPVLIFLPIVAAWGSWTLVASLILTPFDRLTQKAMKRKMPGWLSLNLVIVKSFLQLMVAGLVLSLVFWSVVNLDHQPPPNPDFDKKNYKYQFQPYGPSLHNNFDTFLENPRDLLINLPKIELSRIGIENRNVLNQALDDWLAIDKTTILDVSPYAAGGAIMQGVGLTSDARFINLYHYYASLIHRMWGYQAGVFYGQEPLYQRTNLLTELTDWFGLKYAVLVPDIDPITSKYQATGWQPLKEFNDYSLRQKPELGPTVGSWGIVAWENPQPNGLISLSQRPVILVISDFSKEGYDQIFRAANLGALPYKKAWLVEGSKNIDDYSLDELAEFDGVILHGYGYKNRVRAWERLQEYVQAGGRLFVDTGWQFVAKDWGNKSSPESSYLLPNLLPVTKTHWADIGTSWDGVALAQDLAPVNWAQFDLPAWQGSPWGMALAQRADLRSGAKPLVWKNDEIMMAQWSVGDGEVIWSGINIFSHINQELNQAEGEFLGTILTSFYSSKDQSELEGFNYERFSPDEANFSFNQALDQPVWLLFREASSPYWQANFVSGDKKIKLPIWRAGPGFVLVKLNAVKPGDQLQLQARLNFKDGLLAKTISLITFLWLLAYLVLGQRVNFLTRWRLVKNWRQKWQDQAKSLSTNEEDY